MNMVLPSPVLRAIAMLNDAGFEAYLVGGCVRDHLMGKSPFDWDITTSALPEQTLAVFADHRTIETGIRHGTITVILEDLALEITTYRVDGEYSDGRHPDSVAFSPSLAEDLRRRDFTMNAIAFHPIDGFIDPFGGREDIQNSVIRCVGDPMKRFTEDSLRILRGLRFAATLGFSIERETASAIHQLAATLERVSVERITAEFKRLICGNFSADILGRFHDVITVFLPEWEMESIDERFNALPNSSRMRLAALFRQAYVSSETAENAMRRLKLDTQTIREVSALLVDYDFESYDDTSILRLLNRFGTELIFDYFLLISVQEATVLRTHELIHSGACFSIAALAVNGCDLLEYGISPGPAIGEALEHLLEAVICGQCANTKNDLIDYLKK